MVVSAPLLFMIQALMVWRESSQLLVQRRYAEMNRSVIDKLDKIYRENYLPEFRNLTAKLSLEVSLEDDRLQSKQLERWLGLEHCKKEYGYECILSSRIVLQRKYPMSSTEKTQKLCDSLRSGYAEGFDIYHLKKIRKYFKERQKTCDSEYLARMLDELNLQKSFNQWVKAHHPIKIYMPELLDSDSQISKRAPWNIFELILSPNAYFLWLGGTTGLGNSVLKEQNRSFLFAKPFHNSNWSPQESINVMDFSLSWIHNGGPSLDTYSLNKKDEPTEFNYFLLRDKQLATAYIELIAQILKGQKEHPGAHPEYLKFRANIRSRIYKLFKLNDKQSVPESSLINLIKLVRDEWRKNHLDNLLMNSKISLNDSDFAASKYFFKNKLLDNQIFFGVDQSFLFRESQLANWFIGCTIFSSLLILVFIIQLSFKMLPRPIHNLIQMIKFIELENVLSQRLNFSIQPRGDEIRTLYASFRMMRSEIVLRFQQMHLVRLINQQILNRQPLDHTIQKVTEYLAKCLPLEPDFLGIYYFKSARQTFPAIEHTHGMNIDISEILENRVDQAGYFLQNHETYRWYRTSLENDPTNKSSYMLMVFNENCLGKNINASIQSFLDTVIDQLQALLYQTLLWEIQEDNEIASQLQKGILAPIKYNTNQIEICADMRSCGYLGGDFFSVIPRPESTLFSIADVTSKGIAPALVGNCARSLMHYFGFQAPNVILEKVNKNIISEGFSEQHFVTCFMAEIDESLKMNFVSAGHQMMIHISHDGTLNYLNGPNIPLGLDPDQIFETQSVQLHPGDLIFLYTDGIPELLNAEDEIYSQQRLENFLQKHKNFTANEIEKMLYDEIKTFASKKGLSDDITSVIIKIKEAANI